MHACLQVYTGPGKGKTTAALGLAVRAAGAGWSVYIGQFLKKGKSSELNSLRQLSNIVVHQFGRGPFVWGTPAAADIRAARHGLACIRTAMLGGQYDLVIADEANCAVVCGLLDWQELARLADERPPTVELVITGRGAHREILRRADLVSYIAARKHPFTQGRQARRGIEW